MVTYVVMFHEWEVFPNKKNRRHHILSLCFDRDIAINNLRDYKRLGVLGRIYCYKNGDRFTIRKIEGKKLNRIVDIKTCRNFDINSPAYKKQMSVYEDLLKEEYKNG